jgi:hypothetical protein
MSKFEEAVKLVADAEELEVAGDAMGAVKLYRRAYQLEPSLDPCRSKQAATSDNKEVRDNYNKEREAEEYLVPLPHPPANSGFRTFDAAELLTPDGRRDIFMYAEEYGFVVVDNVLSAEQVAEGVAEFKRYMLANEIDMDNVESVVSGFGDRDLGIVSRASIGQSRFNWLARSNIFVKDAFRAVLGLPQGEGKLITSFDGCGYFVNPEIPHPQGAGNGGPGGASLFGGTRDPWYHFDAGSSDVANYFQGVVNYMDCTPDTEAGIVLLPKSHKTVFPRFYPAENKSLFKNYLSGVNGRLAAKIMDLQLEERPMRVPLKAGSLVLFRSSLMHCNMGCIPREDTANNPAQILRRLVSYICMMEDPQDADLTKQRKEYFKEGKTTAHQPDVLRWVGDRFKPHLLEKGVLCLTEDTLPDGGAELL